MIQRILEDKIIADFRRKKVIVILGARQVGKTTLLSRLHNERQKVLFLNCDNIDDVMDLEGKTSTELKMLLSAYDIVFIDEAQRVKNIGLTLKIIGDLKMDTQVIVTGSSSLDMANEINEPATGRLLEHNLYPLSLSELAQSSSEREEQRLLEQRMIYGLYPEVVTEPSDAKRTLVTLANNYLYKDLFAYKGIKKPDVIQKLVRALPCSWAVKSLTTNWATCWAWTKEPSRITSTCSRNVSSYSVSTPSVATCGTKSKKERRYTSTTMASEMPSSPTSHRWS